MNCKDTTKRLLGHGLTKKQGVNFNQIDALLFRAKKDFKNLMFHFGTSSWGGTRRLPRAFTEQGVAMLSSVLRSKRAIQVNIQIMRAFVKLREMLISHKELAKKLGVLEKKYDAQFKIVFDAIYQLMAPSEQPSRKIGFHREGQK